MDAVRNDVIKLKILRDNNCRTCLAILFERALRQTNDCGNAAAKNGPQSVVVRLFKRAEDKVWLTLFACEFFYGLRLVLQTKCMRDELK